ncbi:MAG TPA: outer membrane beta-barrel domain-containing protein [Steroidobacteraceae bacterium]|nr:outer membrane beta-barrel domain-containing protein [Steroidobacteraceae bacterium]
MESRLRILLLSVVTALVTPGCALFGRGAPDPEPEPMAMDQPVVAPEVERRQVGRPRIDTEDFEVGAHVGLLSIEDFGSNASYGASLAYHLTEDFFLEGMYGLSRAGRTSYENLSGSVELLTDDQRDYTYYSLSVGWNVLPGEIFLGRNRAYTSALYLIGGVGSTEFGGDDRFTINVGLGVRLLMTDSIAAHFNVRDHIFDSDITGEKKTVHNLETRLGVTWFF